MHWNVNGLWTEIPNTNLVYGWNHYELVYNTNTNEKLVYINGKLSKSDATNGAIIIGDLKIGNATALNYYYQGKIDQFKIYNYARTQKQVIEDMNAGTPATSSKSMLAYYKFDEGNGTSTYNSGIGGATLNGTLVGTTIPTWTNNGQKNKALNFTNGFMQTSAITLNSSFTFSGWFNPTSFATTWSAIITNLQNGAPASGLNIIPQSGALRICYGDGINSYSYYDISNSQIVTNKWNYVALSYDGANATIYFNGKQIDKRAITIIQTNQAIRTGIWASSYGDYLFNGSIDEVKIYNYTLTPEEIKQDYNQGSAIQFGTTNQTIGNTTTSLEYCIPGDASPCSAPIAEWKMDEGVGTSTVDTSGNNNNGTIGTGSSAPSWIQGKSGRALSFDGVSNRLPINTTINLNGNANWTVSAWVKTSSAGANPILSNKSSGPVYNDLRIINSKMSYYHYNNAWINETGNITVANGQWNYLTWVNHSNQTMDMYVNGIADTLAISSALSSIGPVDQIGRDWSVTANASIDHVKIYNYARTPAQIAYDYNRGGPVGWWKMDECQGNIAYDWSGIGNTGVINIGTSGTQNSLGTCAVGTSAAWTNGASGKINSSLNFDGVDDLVSTNLSFSNPVALSYSVWVKTNSTSTKQWIICPDDGGYDWTLLLENGKVALMTGTNYWDSTYSITQEWTHIVAVFDTSISKAKLYINGKYLSDATSFGTTTTGTIIIGGYRNNGNSGPFNGKLDDVRVYNYALTSEQIKTIYNGGAVNFR